MRRLERLEVLSAIAAVAVTAACTGNPIPLSAQVGSTIVLPLSHSLEAGLAGFGSEVTKEAVTGYPASFDDQRGELAIVLRDPVSADEYELVTRYVTRLFPDPTSDSGLLNGSVDVTVPFGGQVLALVDVTSPDANGDETLPVVVSATAYDVEVRLRRRDLSDPALPWEFEVDYLSFDIGQLTLLPGQGQPTPDEGFGPFGQSRTGADVRVELRGHVPNPALVIDLGLDPPSGGDPPAAASVTVSFDARKLRVVGASEWQVLGQGSAVRCVGCTGVHDTAACAAGPETREVTVHLVSPDRAARYLAMVFKLCDPETLGRAELTDFTVTGEEYDENGELLVNTPQVAWFS